MNFKELRQLFPGYQNLPGDQRTPAWHANRKGKLTSTKIAAATGLDNGFDSVEDIALEIQGLKKKIFSKEQLDRMNRGTHLEPEARDYYRELTGNRVTNIDFAVPNWDPRIGGSPDGLVGDEGILEVKCPVKMYEPLINHYEMVEVGIFEPPPFYHDHVWKTHYCQYQTMAAILGRKWCDYLVYCPADEEHPVYLERFYFDYGFWDDTYQRIDRFLIDYLGLPNPLNDVIIPTL